MAMLAHEDYVSQVLTSLTPLDPVEMPLHSAHGLVLAEDVTASVAVPPWTNSAMDGYAVRAQDISGANPQHPAHLPVFGDVPAGREPQPLKPGTAQRIMTGAMLPQGADTVVRVEDTDQAPGPGDLPKTVSIRHATPLGTNVRGAGEDLTVGAPVLAAGSILSARALAALASVGRATVTVRPQVRVAVISSGNELRDPGAPLTPGTIPDSNGLLLAGLVAERGALCTSISRSPDKPAELLTHLIQAANQADLVITSGGVSAGAFDPLTALAAEIPSSSQGADDADTPVRLDRSAVAMQPGKPQGHGWVRADDGRKVPLLCLPGNPISVMVSFTTIGTAVLARLGGYDQAPLAAPIIAPAAPARAATSWTTPAGRRQYLPVRLVPTPESSESAHSPESTLWVVPSHRLGSSSHLVASLPAAQALAIVEAEVERVEVGDYLRLLPLSAPATPQ